MRELLSTKRTFLAVLFLGIFALCARTAADPDLWWHLKTGEYISTHHAVPRTDPFSYTRAGQPWVAHEWLTELLLYQLQRTIGFAGLILLFSAILTAAFLFLYLRSGSNPYIAGLGTTCAALATAPLWGIRPQIVSLLLTSLWLLILERSEKNPKLLYWTLPLTLLWVNLHAGFALGLFLSASFLAGGILERVLQPSPPNPSLPFTAVVLCLDLLLVPLNPNGFRLFTYPVETLRSTSMQTYIAEWASPNFHHAEYLPFLLIILATIATLIWARVSIRPRDLLLLVIGMYASLTSIRLIPLFVLIAVPIVSGSIGSPRHGTPLSRRSTQFRGFFNALIILAMAVFAAVHLAQVIQRQPAAEAEQFPTRAVAFLQSNPSLDRIFNNYDWGGYLIWKLYPSRPVFIDGRADVYGESLFREFADAYQLKNPWLEILHQWNVQTVVVPRDSALATGLRAAPGWTLAYQDSQAVIFTTPQ
jgi:hypothetical protein